MDTENRSNHTNTDSLESIRNLIINCAIKVHRTLKNGFLESVYQNALIIELREAGLKCEKEVPIDVKYKNQIVGKYKADIIVEDKFILELKVAESLNNAHSVQLVNYLTATGIDYGYLINFGKFEKLEFIPKSRIYKNNTN